MPREGLEGRRPRGTREVRGRRPSTSVHAAARVQGLMPLRNGTSAAGPVLQTPADTERFGSLKNKAKCLTSEINAPGTWRPS